MLNPQKCKWASFRSGGYIFVGGGGGGGWFKSFEPMPGYVPGRRTYVRLRQCNKIDVHRFVHSSL